MYRKDDTPKQSSTETLVTDRHTHCPHAHIHTLLTQPIPVSPQSRDELKRAVDDYVGVFSADNRPTGLHAPIGKWDVSQVTDMFTIFFRLDTFNEELSNWDVSRVTNMQGMFAYAYSFNQDLSKWNVSRVTNMVAMFREAAFFNQDLSNWDVSRVTDMRGMFAFAHAFQQTLCGDAWVNSDAVKVNMFDFSPGSISDAVCGT